jgi:hypothetical protein
MWKGADGVALRLTANGVNTLHSISANGEFSFPTPLAEDASYAVEIASNPARHACVIRAGANGVVPATGVTSIDVACTGPAVSIKLSAPEPWAFDPSLDLPQAVSASQLLQTVTFTVEDPDNLLASAQVAGVPVAPGTASAPQPLALGANTIDVDLTAQGGLSKRYQIAIDRGKRAPAQSAYGKASNTAPSAYFGYATAISGDTLAVGAYGDMNSQGAVYVFVRTGAGWMQQAYLKASNPDTNDSFGGSLALSGDTVVVGAVNERSKATGINGDQNDNSVLGAGAVYVFQRTAGQWRQQAYIKASTTLSGAFGSSVALSGNTLAVGATAEAGAYVFQRSGTTWIQQAHISGADTVPRALFGDDFGHSVAVSGDTLAVGTPFQDDSSFAGAVYVFHRSGTIWSQQAHLTEPIIGTNDYFGATLALDDDILVAGASGEDSNATGIDGNQSDNSADSAGAAYVFQRTGTTWALQTYIKASNASANDGFGASVAMSGELLAIGAPGEAGGSAGVDGDQTSNTLGFSGAIYLFRRSGHTWTQQDYIKASNPGSGDMFGRTVGLSGDTLAVGATFEASGATGINGNQADDGTLMAGAVYVFR